MKKINKQLNNYAVHVTINKYTLNYNIINIINIFT